MLKLLTGFFIAVTLSFLFKEPEFIDARNFAVRSIGMKTSTVYTDLYYFNPNGFGIQMKKADLDIYIDEQYIGHTQIDTLINIPRKDTFSIPVNMEVEMKKLFPKALSILLKEEIELKIVGTAKLGKSGLFLNVPVRYQGKHRLR
jgi:LEA14-like dessication related protein